MRSVFAHTIIDEEEEGAEGSQRWFGRTKGSAIPPFGFLLSCSLACWIVDVVHMFGGEISNEFTIGDVRDLPHTYSCTCLYSKEKQKWKQEGLCRGPIPGSQNFIQSENVFIWSTKFLFYFYFIYFMLLYIYFFSWQAK